MIFFLIQETELKDFSHQLKTKEQKGTPETQEVKLATNLTFLSLKFYSIKYSLIRLYLFTFTSVKLVSIPQRLITRFIFFYTVCYFRFSLFHILSVQRISSTDFLKKTEKRKITSRYGLFFRRKPLALTYCNKLTYTV